MSRGSVYEAARRGDIDVIQIGNRYKAVSSTLRRKLASTPPRQKTHRARFWMGWALQEDDLVEVVCSPRLAQDANREQENDHPQRTVDAKVGHWRVLNIALSELNAARTRHCLPNWGRWDIR
jgi:hypothetical protein